MAYLWEGRVVLKAVRSWLIILYYRAGLSIFIGWEFSLHIFLRFSAGVGLSSLRWLGLGCGGSLVVFSQLDCPSYL